MLSLTVIGVVLHRLGLKYNFTISECVGLFVKLLSCPNLQPSAILEQSNNMFYKILRFKIVPPVSLIIVFVCLTKSLAQNRDKSNYFRYFVVNFVGILSQYGEGSSVPSWTPNQIVTKIDIENHIKITKELGLFHEKIMSS